MSRIYDSLRKLERAQAAPAQPESAGVSPPEDRRRGPRRFLRIPVLVYGHLADGRPFHEESHMLWVNAQGAMVSLEAPVSPGQRLILIHQGTEDERPCRVVHIGARYARRAHVAIAFVDA